MWGCKKMLNLLGAGDLQKMGLLLYFANWLCLQGQAQDGQGYTILMRVATMSIKAAHALPPPPEWWEHIPVWARDN